MRNSVPDSGKLLTAAEVAEIFRISRRTVYKMIRCGLFGNGLKRIGRNIRITSESVKRIIG